MSAIIKLQRRGTIHKPFWHIVVTDSRKPKSCIEQLGTYDNLQKPVKLGLDIDRSAFWVSQGATPSASVHRIFLKQGVMQKARELNSRR